MDYRTLGRSPLKVSPICLGGNVFGWTVDERTSCSLLDAWLDAGFNFVDTADMYSRWAPGHTGGESETVIGKWFKAGGRRDQVILATKVGMDMGDGKVGLKAANIRRAVEDSLRRLQTDRIDLYQAHTDDADTPLEETLEAFGALVKTGKVRVIGASNYSAPRFKLALETSARLGLPRYESLQPLYNLYDRAVFETELEPLCREQGVGVINFYALAAGFLTGKYRKDADADKSPRGKGSVEKYLNDRGRAILAALDTVAARTRSKPGQVAIATTLEQLAELEAATRIKVSAEDIALLDKASAQ
jgi:aryl-alcohol dehydrogenase-like predicted oxidoreductase